MAVGPMGGRVLDVAALADIATGTTAYGRAFIRLAVQHVIPLAIPTTAFAEAWAAADAKARMSLGILTELSVTVIKPLDLQAAWKVGEVLEGSAGRWAVDLAAGHVAAVAARRGWPVLTDRGVDLRKLVPGLQIEPLP